MLKEKKIREVSKFVVKKFSPEKIILFGSYAWGKPNKNSDVDFCIITKTKNTSKTKREIDGAIFPRPFAIDIIIYTPKQFSDRLKEDDFFVKELSTKGKILYEKKLSTVVSKR